MRTATPRDATESGSISAFVVTFTVALLVVAGLVIDGGLTLAARRRAFNEANAAARAGAQAIDESAFRTTGAIRIRPDRAQALALEHLDLAGLAGTVDINGDAVTVTVTTTQKLAVLGMVGLAPFTIHAVGTARAVQGLRTGGD